MKIIPCSYKKSGIPAWLVCIIFLTAVLAFTGYTGKPMLPGQSSAQTCWQYTISNKVANNAVSFKTASAFTGEGGVTQYFAIYKMAIQIYNKCIQVKFINARKIFLSEKAAHGFVLIPITSARLKEAPAVSIAA